MNESSRDRLADGPFCAVDVCGCGVLHVSIGPFSIRLEAPVVESIWVTLGEAIHRLRARPESSSRPCGGARDSTERRRATS